MPTKREQFSQTIRAQYLGQRMRELRDERGLTLKYVAAYLGVEFSTLARYERAEWPFRKDHVIGLLDVYGVYDDNQRNQLVALAANAWRADHWYRDGIKSDATHGPMPDRWWVQNRAQQICVYSPNLIPALLQTAAYADEILSRAQLGKVTKEQREKYLHDNAARAKALSRPEPVQLHTIVDERALHRPVGGTTALRAQLEHLVETARFLPGVEIQVLRDATQIHPGLFGAFTVYRMPQPYPDIAYLDHPGGGLLIEGSPAEQLNNLFNDLAKEHAEPANDSIALINIIKEEL
ncbi:helix-turn-helix domain-containing protein [Micromonospora sp. CPCC 206061]|uniref:helix-turn-helix domain-containing protein n=1 Tax=Micromonospora sp. CPCC 206061 TaxID=3122410 RepID=UPI002FEF15E5